MISVGHLDGNSPWFGDVNSVRRVGDAFDEMFTIGLCCRKPRETSCSLLMLKCFLQDRLVEL